MKSRCIVSYSEYPLSGSCFDRHSDGGDFFTAKLNRVPNQVLEKQHKLKVVSCERWKGTVCNDGPALFDGRG